MFNIDYITILPGCHYTKNLTENHPYRFNMELAEGFFGKNINVHAIVGKNGSGKSSLLEIMFRLINNLSFCLLKDIPRNASDDIRYSFGLFAEMGWTINKKKGTLTCKDGEVTFKSEGIEKDIKFKVREEGGMTVFMYGYDFSREYALMKTVAENFFYTVVLNYSMQSYVAQDYVGEECKSRTSNRHKSWMVDDVWINALFHKNDGYMCPINLNPYRDEGQINMNKEMILTRERVSSMLEYFKQEEKSIIDGYRLAKVIYTYNSGKVNGYFDSMRLVDMENEKFPTTDKDQLKFRKDTADVEGNKAERISELFILAIESAENNIAKTILSHYGIDTTIRDRAYVKGMTYLVCKVLNIGLVYPKYLLLTGKGDAYTYWDALAEKGDDYKIEVVEKLLSAIDNEDSHITEKVKRALRFFKYYQKIKRNAPFQLDSFDENMGFSGAEYRKGLGIEENTHLTLKEIEQSQPISIFRQHVYVQELDKAGNPKDKLIELRQLSSGERQYVFTLSSIVYHLTNLLSVKDENPKYHNFNIIIDELEICMHPDYQRMFVSKMLNLLERLELNKAPLNLNIVFCTHSPFTLSDIPKQNILYLDNGKDVCDKMEQETFGANVNELLAESFFLSGGFMGEFAKNKIVSLVKYLQEESDADNKSVIENQVDSHADINNWDKDSASALIEMVGDDVIRMQLRSMFAKKFEEDKDSYTAWLQSECRRMGI